MSEQRSATFELKRLQGWMQSSLAHPLGVSEGVDSDLARAQIDVGAEDLERVLTASTTQTALERLGIYSYAYHARLIDCLRELFPVLEKTLGAELFGDFAVGYLERYPSRSYTLFALGQHFARYLEETRPHREDQVPDSPAWPDFLIELATLEHVFNEVFDGPGTERQSASLGDALAELAPEQILNSRIVLNPSLRLLTFQFPVHEYWSRMRREVETDIPAPVETCLAVFRHEYIVRHCELSDAGLQLLRLFQQRETLAKAMEVVLDAHASADEALPMHMHVTFRDWAALGIVIAVEKAD